jgi:hypothetical protein
MDTDMLIAAQYPLPGNSIDMFRLFLDHESDIVVFVNRLVDIPSVSGIQLKTNKGSVGFTITFVF